jgi:hypothetical protein
VTLSEDYHYEANVWKKNIGMEVDEIQKNNRNKWGHYYQPYRNKGIMRIP